MRRKTRYYRLKMSKLNIDQKTIKKLFQDAKSIFIIPDYQRPYAWGVDECKTLWDDIFAFSFPDGNSDNFRREDEYFLGPIVTYRNENGQHEIIDGQQRLTTFMLLLRAFYNKLGHMKDERSASMKKDIEKCIWQANEFGEYKNEDLMMISRVAMDTDKEEFLQILREGKTEKTARSRYAHNFSFFKEKIDTFLNEYPSYFAQFPARILNNCVLLPIEAESQDTALRIFSTLNDRGKPLSDADIFKAQFYKHYSSLGRKDEFIDTWRELEKIATDTFHTSSGSSLDELFTKYMYYERALSGNKSSTTESLRKFYEKGNYKLLKEEGTLNNLRDLVHFWQDVSNQDKQRFCDDETLRRLFVLNYAPNGMWTYIVSVYFMHHRDSNGKLDEKRFCAFLNKITAFIWAYAITNPGVNSLRTPIYAEMENIVKGEEVMFKNFLFEETRFRAQFGNYEFSNNRAITKSMITWWAFSFPQQELLTLTDPFDIEHIFSRNRQKNEGPLSNPRCLEMLGNKSLLERRINIRASDYRFVDKKKYYGKTKIYELGALAETQEDFRGQDILTRSENMTNKFVDYLRVNNLLISDDLTSPLK